MSTWRKVIVKNHGRFRKTFLINHKWGHHLRGFRHSKCKAISFLKKFEGGRLGNTFLNGDVEKQVKKI